MSHTYSTRMVSTLAAVSGLIAGGFLAASVPAQAAPGDCEQFGFAGFTTLRATQPNGGIVDLNFNATGPTVNAPVTSPQEPTAPRFDISGGIDANGHAELSLAQAMGDVTRFTGDVGPDRKLHGQFLLTEGPVIPAETLAPVRCAKEAAKLGPTVSWGPTLGGLIAHITDRSGVTSQCTYKSDFYQRSFRLDANTTFDLRIVPAIPKFGNWDVNVTCDNGTSTQTTEFF